MPGLVPGIHVLGTMKEVVDGQVKPGHDVERAIISSLSLTLIPA